MSTNIDLGGRTTAHDHACGKTGFDRRFIRSYLSCAAEQDAKEKTTGAGHWTKRDELTTFMSIRAGVFTVATQRCMSEHPASFRNDKLCQFTLGHPWSPYQYSRTSRERP